jgi:hypothetical protein
MLITLSFWGDMFSMPSAIAGAIAAHKTVADELTFWIVRANEGCWESKKAATIVPGNVAKQGSKNAGHHLSCCALPNSNL